MGQRSEVHSTSVEGANSVLKSNLADAANISHPVLSARTQLALQSSPTCIDDSGKNNVNIKWSTKREHLEQVIAEIVECHNEIDDVLGDIQRWVTPKPFKRRTPERRAVSDSLRFMATLHREWHINGDIRICYVLSNLATGDRTPWLCFLTHYKVGLLGKGEFLDVPEASISKRSSYPPTLEAFFPLVK